VNSSRFNAASGEPSAKLFGAAANRAGLGRNWLKKRVEIADIKAVTGITTDVRVRQGAVGTSGVRAEAAHCHCGNKWAASAAGTSFAQQYLPRVNGPWAAD